MKKFYLIGSGIGLSLIALTYGLVPSSFLPQVYGIDASSVNLLHISRALMCAYFGMSAYWIYNAINVKDLKPAILADIFFMGGLALGRLLSITVDGVAHWLLMAYLGLEIFMALWGIAILKFSTKK